MLSHEQHSNPWEQLKQAIKAQIPAKEYATWFSPLQVARTDGQNMTVRMPNTLFYQRIHDEYLPLIERTKSELGLEHHFINFELEGVTDVPPPLYTEDVTPPTSLDQNEVQSPAATTTTSAFSRTINKESNLNRKALPRFFYRSSPRFPQVDPQAR